MTLSQIAVKTNQVFLVTHQTSNNPVKHSLAPIFSLITKLLFSNVRFRYFFALRFSSVRVRSSHANFINIKNV